MPRRNYPALIATVAVAGALFYCAPGVLDVSHASPTASYLDHAVTSGPQQQIWYVYSAAMDRVVPLQVLTPADNSAPRPTLYLLNGAGGGEDAANWYNQTDVVEFLGTKNVNVITPAAGAFSYYTDWQRPDKKLGINRWATFLTQELPPIVDATLHTSGLNAIAGMSMSATSALDLAASAPSLYQAVAAYSGCASTSDDDGRAFIKLVLARGGADPKNMWGPDSDPAWHEHDAIVNADRLRGKAIYISSGSGLPGVAEQFTDPITTKEITSKVDRMFLGGAIEAATNSCTHRLADRLAQLNIPAQVEFRPTGTHTWHYWESDLHNSWPMIARALNIE